METNEDPVVFEYSRVYDTTTSPGVYVALGGRVRYRKGSIVLVWSGRVEELCERVNHSSKSCT